MGNKTEAPVIVEDNQQNTEVGSVLLTDGTYKIDISSSVISWEGERITGAKEQGTVMLETGEVAVTEGQIANGKFVINMETITSEPFVERLVNHLKSDDFFKVDSFKTAEFNLKGINPTSEEGAKMGRYVIAGDLTIKGITKPISFTATVNSVENSINAKASFAINRADWEIKYQSPTFFQNLGDKVIRDAITIGLDLKADKVIQ